ncbi:MAG: radical SAM protein [Brevinematales bacterium]|nr:radical SAM protein [Brevinematales bacterium]
MKFLIIDGFVDEPTCLGVPPYISTYVRYVAGAAKLAGLRDVHYKTITELREKDFILENCEYSTIIAGNPVPGKYLGGNPIELKEIEEIAKKNRKTKFFLGGPIQFENCYFDHSNLKIIEKDIEAFIFHFFRHSDSSFRYRSIEELNEFAVNGAFIVNEHPRYPDIIAEIETGRGCPRVTHCSFCVEGLFEVDFREPKDIIEEIYTLNQYGVKHFRIGKQADLYSYGGDLSKIKNGFPKPNSLWIEYLYKGIRDKIPNIKTLHLDNVNPGTIANFPEESKKITEIIVEHNTPGDVAAFGMESADPLVIEKNSLKASPYEVYFAIEMLNQIGGIRENGIPKLLPGINLIKGLIGENKDTFRKNYEFLLKVKEDGLLLRRINIRQIKPSNKTQIKKAYSGKDEKILDAIFRNYREKIRNEIDNYMLKQIFPEGTILRNLIVESHRGDWSLARQIGTYPITVNIPKKIEIHKKIDSFVIAYRERSIVGFLFPFSIKNASLKEIEEIPGIGKKASDYFLNKETFKKEISKLKIFEKIRANLID